MQRSIAGLEPAENGRGVIPDHPVPVTIEAVMEGKDLALEKALELIGGQ